MMYQVETRDGVHESMCTSLADARRLARLLWDKGVPGIQIARYDRSGASNHYEVVETFPTRKGE